MTPALCCGAPIEASSLTPELREVKRKGYKVASGSNFRLDIQG